jgi:hypothetical protein
MATSTISGIGGTLQTAAGVVADIKGWSLTRTAKLGEIVSSSTGGIVQRVVGATDWTAKADFVCDGSTPANLPVNGATVTLDLRAGGVGTARFYNMVGWVESIDINLTVSEEPVGGTVNISGNGAITEGNVT